MSLSESEAESAPRPLLPNLISGAIVGLVALIYSISSAALVFSGELATYLPQGVKLALLGSIALGVVMALLSQFPFTVAGSETKSAVVLGGLTGAIAQQLGPDNPALWSTLQGAIALTTLATGLSLFLLGRFRLGRLARYIPYPVMGGFLAGTGWLIARSSFVVMTGDPLTWGGLAGRLQPAALVLWLPGLVFALLLLLATRRYKHYLVLPGLLLGGLALFHLLWQVVGRSPLPVARSDWFFEPVASTAAAAAASGKLPWSDIAASQIDWGVIFQHSGTIVAVAIVTIITTLLDTTGAELATQIDVDLDREMSAAGLANGAAALTGGMVGNPSVNRGLLNYRAGGNSPVAALTAAAVCLAVLLAGSRFLSYFPKGVFGGLLLFLGLTLLVEWVVLARLRLPRLDYGLVLLILVIIALRDFVVGVGAGVVIACLLFIVNYSRNPLVRSVLSGASYQSNVGRSLSQRRFLHQEGQQIYALILQGYLFFGTANSLVEQVRLRLRHPKLPPLQYLVLDFRQVSGLDSSAVLSFAKLKKLGQQEPFQLIFASLSPTLRQQLEQGECLSPNDPQCIVLEDLDRGMEWCENQLLDQSGWRRGRSLPLSLQLDSLFADGEQAGVFMDALEPLMADEGTVLFHQGDRADRLFFVESGQVSLMLPLAGDRPQQDAAHSGGDAADDSAPESAPESALAPDSAPRSIRLQTVGSGMVVGELACGGKTQHHPVTAVVNQPSSLYVLSNAAFRQLQQDHPQTAIAFLEAMIGQLSERLTYASEEIRELLS